MLADLHRARYPSHVPRPNRYLPVCESLESPVPNARYQDTCASVIVAPGWHVRRAGCAAQYLRGGVETRVLLLEQDGQGLEGQWRRGNDHGYPSSRRIRLFRRRWSAATAGVRTAFLVIDDVAKIPSLSEPCFQK